MGIPLGVPLTARVTEVVNRTKWIILLYECEEHDPKGRFCRPIELKPEITREIPASRFLNNHEYGKNARTIKVKRIDSADFHEDGKNARTIKVERIDSADFEDEFFSGQDFLIHHRIIFRNQNRDGSGPLKIEKVRDPKSGSILAEIRRTKLMRYFWRPEAPQIPGTNHPQSHRSDSSSALIPGC